MYSFTHNHGSGKQLYLKGNDYWRDPFLTSIIMGGSVIGSFRNPAPVDRWVYPTIYKVLASSQVVAWDFFHQQYVGKNMRSFQEAGSFRKLYLSGRNPHGFTLPETNIFAPENRPKVPKRKRESIPTIHFQGRTVSFREDSWFIIIITHITGQFVIPI